MEKLQRYAVTSADVTEHILGFEKAPAGRSDATVLVAVRVAHHDHLAFPPPLDMPAVQIEAEQFLEDGRPGLQILDGLQQGSDVQGRIEAPP